MPGPAVPRTSWNSLTGHSAIEDGVQNRHRVTAVIVSGDAGVPAQQIDLLERPRDVPPAAAGPRGRFRVLGGRTGLLASPKACAPGTSRVG